MQSTQTKPTQPVLSPSAERSGPQPLDPRDFKRVVGGLPKGGWGVEPESQDRTNAG